MSTNSVNMSEDAEMADCDGEKVVTMMDVLQEQQDFEEDANAVLGASDDKNCTYSKGYIKRQAIYACMTCCSDVKEDETKRAGVCLACSLSCHENHELIELYTKRNFRCDCGNPKFNSHPCQFNLNKSDINEDNMYNQNYSGLYCICHRPYPDPEAKVEDEMIQCIICEDWLHASHLDAVVPPNDQYSEMICKGCMEKNEFLHDYSDFAVAAENADVDVVSTNDVTISNGHPSDSVLETSKENFEGNMSVDVELNYQMEDNNMKNKMNEEVAPINITESANTKNYGEVEQTKKESVIDPVINTENLAEDKNEIQSPNKIDKTEDVNKFSIDSNDITQEGQEKLDPSNFISSSNSHEEVKTDEKVNEIISESTIANENKTHDTNLDNSEILDKNQESDPIIKEEKLLYEEETSDNTTPTGDEEMKTEKCEETTLENIKDETIKTDTETPAKEQPKDVNLSLGTTESENSDINTKTDNQEKITVNDTEKEDVQDPEPENTKLQSDPDKVDSSASNLDITNSVNDNKNGTSQTVGSTEEDKSITEEIPLKIENITEEIYTKSKDELPKPDNIKEENEMQEKKQTVNPTEESEVDVPEQKDHSDKENKVPNETITNASENKRKLSMDEVKDNVATKRVKVNEAKTCLRQKNCKKHFKGATFWPSNFRQKLCTCNECLTMYKDLSVLFLIDPEDTVSAYETLGKEKTEGNPSSQYEKGLQALSSLDRIQQINALTEYNKMRDKLLDFLKSFKDRREIVKEEDIKGFFAGMKPKREPDGVYFCR